MLTPKNLNWRKALKYTGLLFLLIGLGLSLCINIHLRQYGEDKVVFQGTPEAVQTSSMVSRVSKRYSPTFLPQWCGSLYNDLKFIELMDGLPDSYNAMLQLVQQCNNQLRSIIFYNLSFVDLFNGEGSKCLSSLQTAIEYDPSSRDARYNWELLAQQGEESASDGIPREGEGDKLFREKEQDRSGKYGTGESEVGW